MRPASLLTTGRSALGSRCRTPVGYLATRTSAFIGASKEWCEAKRPGTEKNIGSLRGDFEKKKRKVIRRRCEWPASQGVFADQKGRSGWLARGRRRAGMSHLIRGCEQGTRRRTGAARSASTQETLRLGAGADAFWRGDAGTSLGGRSYAALGFGQSGDTDLFRPGLADDVTVQLLALHDFGFVWLRRHV